MTVAALFVACTTCRFQELVQYIRTWVEHEAALETEKLDMRRRFHRHMLFSATQRALAKVSTAVTAVGARPAGRLLACASTAGASAVVL
jgi:hypothetical protein